MSDQPTARKRNRPRQTMWTQLAQRGAGLTIENLPDHSTLTSRPPLVIEAEWNDQRFIVAISGESPTALLAIGGLGTHPIVVCQPSVQRIRRVSQVYPRSFGDLGSQQFEGTATTVIALVDADMNEPSEIETVGGVDSTTPPQSRGFAEVTLTAAEAV